MWMPTANDEDVKLAVPQSPYLKLSSSSVQIFNKWSRVLLTYVRLPESVTGPVIGSKSKEYNGIHADELNEFRRRAS
jgi:tRNA (guanine10-N2)-methyltransferase